MLGSSHEVKNLWEFAKMAEKLPDFMTVHSVARQLAVSKKRIYQLIRSGRLVSLKLSPRSTRITRVSVEQFVDQRLRNQRRELGLAASAVRRTDR